MKNSIISLFSGILLLTFNNIEAQPGNSNSQGNSSSNSSQAYNSNSLTYAFGTSNWNVYCFNGDILYDPSNSIYFGMYTENNISFDSRARWANTSLPSNANALSGNAYNGIAPLDIKHSVSYKRVGFTNSYYKLEVPAHDDHASLLIDGIEVWKDRTYTTKSQVAWTGYLNTNSTVEFRWINFALTSNGSLTLTPSVALSFQFDGLLIEETKSKNICVSWNTTNEENMEVFIIERTTESDYSSIQELTTIKAKGSATKTAHYEWIDTNPTAGIVYYRIKGVDGNGKLSYSYFQKINIQSLSKLTLNIFPNPAYNQEVNLFINNPTSGDAIVNVSDSFGKTIDTFFFNAELTNSFTIKSTANYAPGVYHITCIFNNQSINQDLLIF